MTDYRTLQDKPYLGSFDLPQGQTITATIENIYSDEVVSEGGQKRSCIIAKLSNTKPMILNATNCKTLAALFDSPYIENWRGPVVIGVEKVRFGSELVEGLRIKPYLPKSQKLICADCGQNIREARGKTPSEIAQSTQRRYGRCLCADCAIKEADKRKALQAETPEGQLAGLIG